MIKWGGRGIGHTSRRARSAGNSLPAIPTLPGTPYALYTAEHSTVQTSGGRVTSASNLKAANDPLLPVSGWNGPLALTDDLGRKFWRFESSEAMHMLAVTLSDRDHSVFFVGRNLTFPTTQSVPIFSVGAVANATNGRSATAGDSASLWWTQTGSGAPPFLKTYTRLPAYNLREPIMFGSQPAVFGMSSKATGIDWFMSGLTSTTTNTTVLTGTNIAGATIGAGVWTSAPGVGNGAPMDVYAIVVYQTGINNTDAASVVSALQSSWNISTIDGNFFLDGNSIFLSGGGTPVARGSSLPALLGRPGNWPTNIRLITMASTGSTIATMLTRATANANNTGWTLQTRPGGTNQAIIECVYNEIAALGRNRTALGSYNNSDAVGDGLLAYLQTASTGTGSAQTGAGPLAAGFDCLFTTPIATNVSTANQTRISDYRALITGGSSPGLTADVGGTYPGKVHTYALHSYLDGGVTRFDVQSDAANTTYYNADGVHLVAAGVAPQAEAARLAVTSAFGF